MAGQLVFDAKRPRTAGQLHLDEEETQFMNGTKTAYRIAAIRIVAALCATVIFANGTFCAEIVFEQTQSGTIGVASTNADVIIEISQGYDNFVISDAVEISAVHWTGAFFGAFFLATFFRRAFGSGAFSINSWQTSSVRVSGSSTSLGIRAFFTPSVI